MATIRTIYEVSKPQQQFYSVERVGYTDLSTATYQIVNDLLQLGAFTIANVNFKSLQSGSLSAGSWPIGERQYSLTSGGSGYKVGDALKVQGGVGTTPYTIRVDSVKTESRLGVTYGGVISTFTVTDAGTYTVDPGPADDLPIIYTNPLYSVATLIIRGNVTSSTGNVVVPPARNSAQVNDTDWITSYGTTGGGGIDGSRWPEDGAWCFNTDFDANVVIGSLVSFESGSNDALIPEGTYVTKIVPISGIVNGISRASSLAPYYEKTTEGFYLQFSQPITIRKGDRLNFRGFGATVENLNKKIPNQWQVTLEAGGAVDPLNDNIGVFGNVVAGITDGNVIQVTNLVTSNNYNPVIYAGQTVTQPPNAIGTPLPAGVLVKSVDNYTEVVAGQKVFKANVTLNTNVTVPTDKQLQFVFSNPQPWRVCFQVLENVTTPASGSQMLCVYAATELQLPNNGVIYKVTDSSGTHVDWAGLIGNVWSNPATKRPDRFSSDQGFYNREARIKDSPNNYPINYSLTITNRGIFLGMWEGNWSTLQLSTVDTTKDNFFNWFLIQRPVNRLTGKVVTTGRCPVFCINGVGFKYWKFIVREEDVLHPTTGPVNSQYRKADPLSDAISDPVNTPYRVPADYHTIDSFAILNTTSQISLTEDSKYLLSFLNNLTTPRFRYPDELDMIGQTSADVVGQGVELSITPYGQTLPSTYRALPANNKYNTGMRICVIKDIPTT